MDRITLRGAVTDWKVKMYGLKRKDGKRQTYTLDRGSYDSCATPGCHGVSWTNPTTQKTWSGVPLFSASARSTAARATTATAPTTRRSRSGATASSSSSATGKYAIIGSRTIRNRDEIILANKLMGSELTAKYYPLRLVGPRSRARSKSIGRITKIYLLPK